MLNDALGGVREGLLSWSEQYRVAVTEVDGTSSIVEYDRPSASESCQVTLYTNYARTLEHPDTQTPAAKADDRDGNSVVDGHVLFHFGRNSNLALGTQYWFEIDCSSAGVVMTGSLLTPWSPRIGRTRDSERPRVRVLNR
jgi:hypothetical protein